MFPVFTEDIIIVLPSKIILSSDNINVGNTFFHLTIIIVHRQILNKTVLWDIMGIWSTQKRGGRRRHASVLHPVKRQRFREYNYCTILTECSVTGHKQLWIEHLRCFITGHEPLWTLHWVNFCMIWPNLAKKWTILVPVTVKFCPWTWSPSVHKHHMSHPVNTWLKWYSTAQLFSNCMGKKGVDM